MARRVVRSSLLVALGLLAAPAVLFGCREILSFEERELDASLTDGGSDADAAVEPLSCEAYCASIQSLCKGGNAQYSSEDSCLGLCETFPKGTLDDETGNTLGCRIRALETDQPTIETAQCANAGPGGNGTCGDPCEAYCVGMETVCPDVFTGVSDCMETCTPLIDCGVYTVPEITPDDPSIQCRIYHLSAAAENLPGAADGETTPSQTKHCPHASGATECIAVADPQCP